MQINTHEAKSQLSTLPSHHGDPFYRMPVAQAQSEGLSLVSADGHMQAYGVARVW